MTNAVDPHQLPTSRRRFLQITAAAAAVSGAYFVGRQWPVHGPLITRRETRTLMGTVINLAIIADDEEHGRPGHCRYLCRNGAAHHPF